MTGPGLQDGGSGRGWATGHLGNWGPTGAQSWRDAADFVLQRRAFLCSVRPELEMRSVGLKLERMVGGEGVFSFSPFPDGIFLCLIENVFLFSNVSIVKKFSLGSCEQVYLNEV